MIAASASEGVRGRFSVQLANSPLGKQYTHTSTVASAPRRAAAGVLLHSASYAMLDTVKEQFDACFSKMAHVHHYQKHGLEAESFKQAREMMETQLGSFYNSR